MATATSHPRPLLRTLFSISFESEMNEHDASRLRAQLDMTIHCSPSTRL